MDEDEFRLYLDKEGEDLSLIPEFTDGEELDTDFYRSVGRTVLEDGAYNFVQHYKPFIKIFNSVNRTPENVIIEAIKAISKGMDAIMNELSNVTDDMDREEKKKLRKAIATCLFLIYKAYYSIEPILQKEIESGTSAPISHAKGKKKRKEDVEESSHYYFWVNEWRSKFILKINKILNNNFDKVNNNRPQVPYIKCATLICYLIVKNSSDKLADDYQLMQNTFGTIGVICNHYDEEDLVITRIIPLIKNEESAKTIAHGINIIQNNYPQSTIILSSIKVLLDTHQKNSEAFKDTSGDRGTGVYLNEIMKENPKYMLKSLPFAFLFLESEATSIRSFVINMLGELLDYLGVEGLEYEEESEEITRKKEIRSQILGSLLEHLCDVNALVRNKTLQTITKLMAQEGNESITFEEILHCLDLAKLRVLDKSTTTRKNAITFIRHIINFNPIFLKFNKEEFLRTLKARVLELIEVICIPIRDDIKIMKVYIREFVGTFARRYADINIPDFPDDPEVCLPFILEMLNQKNYWSACEALCVAIRNWNLSEFTSFKQLLERIDSQEIYVTFFLKLLNQDIPLSQDDETDIPSIVGEVEEAKTKRKYITYFMNSEKLGHIFSEVHPIMNKLLEFGTDSDKTEVLNFYATIVEFGYRPNNEVTFKIIQTISNTDKKVSSVSSMCELFQKIFFDQQCNSELGVAKKLIEVIGIIPPGDKANLGDIIEELYNSEVIDNKVIEIFWNAYCQRTPGWSDQDSATAIFILGIIGQKEEKIIKANLNLLIEVGFGERGYKDFDFLKATLDAITVFVNKTIPTDDENTNANLSKPLFLPSDHELFTKCKDFIRHCLKGEDDRSQIGEYGSAVNSLLFLIYKIASEPEITINEILKMTIFYTFVSSSDSLIKDSELAYHRYFTTVNSILSGQMYYNEVVISNEVKRRKFLKNKEKDKEKGSKKQQRKANKENRKSQRALNTTTTSMNATNANGTMNATNANGTMNATNANGTMMSQEDMELDKIVGFESWDMEAEKITSHTESLLNKGCLLQFQQHVFYTCKNYKAVNSLNLKVAVIRALTNIMSVSSYWASKGQEIYTYLWPLVEDLVKCEMIRLGIMLATRFPNQVEKINGLVLSSIHHHNEKIRKSSLDYIIFLALGDLVKVREQLTEVAICICDESEDIRDSSRDFLKRCAEKENMLNNALPDIISRLSARSDVPSLKFQEIMTFLLEIAKKERLMAGGLSNKLLARFKNVEKGKQSQDLAFCLQKLSFNDKSLKTIRDNFNAFSDKLDDPEVLDCFAAIIASLRKNCKSEAKIKIDELEKDIEEARKKCEENARIARIAARGGITEEEENAIANTNSDSDDDDIETEGEAIIDPEELARVETERFRDELENEEVGSESESEEDEQLEKNRTIIRNRARRVIESEEEESDSESEEESEPSRSSSEVER